jgi:hypothetical protein
MTIAIVGTGIGRPSLIALNSFLIKEYYYSSYNHDARDAGWTYSVLVQSMSNADSSTG